MMGSSQVFSDFTWSRPGSLYVANSLYCTSLISEYNLFGWSQQKQFSSPNFSTVKEEQLFLRYFLEHYFIGQHMVQTDCKQGGARVNMEQFVFHFSVE